MSGYFTRQPLFSSVLLILACTVNFFFSDVDGVPVNVASGRPISALYTCGYFGDEQFQLLSDSYVPFEPPPPKTCLQSNGSLEYGPDKMNDNDDNTYWESAELELISDKDNTFGGSKQEILIDLDLEQIFSVQRISIQMGDSNAPNGLEILKSNDNITFTPWIYIVKNRGRCQSLFQVSYNTQPSSNSDVVCVEGAGNIDDDTTTAKIEVDMSSYPISYNDWKEVRYIKIGFYDMDDKSIRIRFNEKYDHYAVSSLEVWAECTCNGLQDGCQFSNVSNSYECICGFNSAGRFCEKCKPLHNQHQFEYGVECKECECYQHSSECYYNSTIELFSKSINKGGVYSGGGVCVDCDHNTTGINCEKCKSYFYRPLTMAKNATDTCSSCECNEQGSDINPMTALLGDCVRVINDSVLPIGMNAGDCYCKANVEGSKCDGCKANYFNLTAENLNGCQACECHLPGTVNASSTCAPDTMGQCPCKQFTTNRQCSECIDNYHSLDMNNTAGCTSCDCDIGGSFSPVCNKQTGQCPCRSNIEGPQCNRASDGFYTPSIHHVRFEFESLSAPYFDTSKTGYTGQGYMNFKDNNDSLSTQGSIPQVINIYQYTLILKYATHSPTHLSLQMNETGSGVPIVIDETVEDCGSPSGWCFTALTNGTMYNFTTDIVSAQLTVDNSQGNEFIVDYLAAVPGRVLSASVLGAGGHDTATECDFVSQDLPTNGSCEASVFSIMTELYNGSLSCDCDLTGSVNSSCDPYGGQCVCKPGVGGRQCDHCIVEYHSFSQNGCSACNCAADNKICDFISGQCECPVNTVGRQCNRCKDDHWNWDSAIGCEACLCDTVGSVHLQCNLTHGQCDCKPGVAEVKCSKCLAGFKNLTTEGCTDCQCDVRGSEHDTCNYVTGQCPCKSNVDGLLCDQCKPGTFNLASQQTQGCLDCICMGITSVCDSTTYFTKSVLIDNYSTFDLISAGADSISFTTQNDSRVQAFIIAGQQPYFRSSLATGNLLGLSRINYTTTLTKLTPGLNGNITAILTGRNNTKLVYDFGIPASDDVTLAVELVFNEHHWLEESTNKVLTRGEFLLAISDVQSLLLPTWNYQGNYSVTFGPVEFTWAKEDFVSGTHLGDIEQCSCGQGYTGLSCENCTYGYKRANVSSHDYLGVCVACECNGHADYCDPDTGTCVDCQHNTTGVNCEICLNGFYGDATNGTSSDCSACPCYEPRVANSTCAADVNGTVKCSFCNQGYNGNLCDSCDNFYWGNPEELFTGTCQSCDCNGNTDVCNQTTGECIDCGFNSTGFTCERCLDGLFGDSSTQSCQDCSCDLSGTVNQSTICNHTTGQCPCLPGVNNRTCSECQRNFYGYRNTSINGCEACNCVPSGSKSLQCDGDTGACKCENQSGGLKCDLCARGLFGLPYKKCENCFCNVTGTVIPSAPCEVVFGQCGCKPGVSGRSCDQCMFMHSNFSDSGCKACGHCQQALGSDTQRLASLWETYWNTTNQINALGSMDSELESLRDKLNTTLLGLGFSAERLVDLSGLMTNLTTQEESLNSTAQQFNKKVQQVLTNSKALESVTSTELTRIVTLQSNATEVHTEIVTALQHANSMILLYNSRITDGQTMRTDGADISSTLSISFKPELLTIDQQYGETNNTLLSVRSLANMTRNEDKYAMTNEVRAQLLRESLVQLQSRYEAAMNVSSEVAARLQVVDVLYTQAMQNKLYAEGVFSQAVSELNMTMFTVNEAQSDYNIASNTLEAVVNKYEGVDISGFTTYTTEGVPCVIPFTYKKIVYNNCTYVDNPGSLWCQTSAPGEGFTWGVCVIRPTPAPFTGWLKESASLSTWLNSTQVLVASVESEVEQAKLHSQSLTSQTEAIVREFTTVEGRGERAVSVIQNFESVVASLQASLEQAQEANKTIAQVVIAINEVTAEELELKANVSLAYSDATLFNVNAKNGTTTDLTAQLVAANISLQSSIQTWNAIYNELGGALQRVNNLSALIRAPSVASKVFDAQQLTSGSNNKVQQVELTFNKLLGNMTTQGDMIDEILATRLNITRLRTEVSSSLTAYNNKLLEMKSKITQITNAKSDDLRARIQSKYNTVLEKLAKAKELAQNLEKPVRFHGNMSVTRPNTVLNSPFNTLSLEFRTTNYSTGLLFYAQGTNSASEFTLQLRQGKVEFIYNTGSGATKLVSQANICENCWFRVGANRILNKGMLVVTKLDTGGSASTDGEGPSTDLNLTLDNTYYLAGLPDDFSIASGKYVTDQKFEGSIHNVLWNNEPVNLWQHLKIDGYSSFTSKPPSIVAPIKQPGVSFNGFGYLELAQAGFDVSLSSRASFEFRTFEADSTLLFVGKSGSDEFYKLSMEGGHLVFQYGSRSVNTTLKSDDMYHDGKWYQITVGHNVTSMEMTVANVTANQTSPRETKSVNTVVTPMFELSSNAQLFLGGYSADFSLGSRTSFAGCIRNLKLSSSIPVLSDRNLDVNTIITASEVSMDGCYAEIEPGLNVMSLNSLASYNVETQLLNFQRLELELFTTSSSGIIAYFHSETSVSRKKRAVGSIQSESWYKDALIVSLVNEQVLLTGDRRVLPNPMVTAGLSLADGRRHSMVVDFTASSPRIIVDGETFISDTAFTQGIHITDNPGYIYLGGLPTDFVSDGYLPTTKSLVGTIQNVRLNSMDVDVTDVKLMRDQDRVSLVTFPPLESPPPLPYSTTTPLITTPAPTCSPINKKYEYLSGLRFGDASTSYLRFNIPRLGWEADFNTSFVLNIRFKAYSANGIILSAGNTNINAENYFMVYIENGRLNVALQTTLRVKHLLETSVRVDTGLETEVQILRIHDFLALYIRELNEYQNNQIGAGQKSYLNIKNLFIGGTSSSLDVGKSLHGCIMTAQMTSATDLREFTIDLSESDRPGVETCSSNLKRGLSFDGNAYALLRSDFLIDQTDLVITMIFTSHNDTANLLTMYSSMTSFFAIDLLNGQIRVTLGNANSVNDPFTAAYEAELTKHTICDSSDHRLSVRLTKYGMDIEVDNGQPQGFAFLPALSNTSMPFYVGGLPLKGKNIQFPVTVSKDGLDGCLSQLTVNGNEIYAYENLDGTRYGCYT